MRHRTRWAIAVAGGVLLASGCDSPLTQSDLLTYSDPPATEPIVYRCDCPSGHGLYRVNLDGREAVLLTTVHNTSSIAWSPDGTKIAYDDAENLAAEDFRSQIYVINADGTGKHAITNVEDGAGAKQPAWSPDGSRILFVSSVLRSSGLVDRGIYVVNSDGSGVQRLTPTDDPALYGGPAWSPDGSTIAFYKGILDEETSVYVPHLYLMNSDGSNQRALTADSIHMNHFNRLVWSPQGDLLAFEVYGPGTAGAHIATIKPDGSHLRYVTDPGAPARSPSWSPDGRHLVFQGEGQDNQPQLYIINRDGTGKERVTTGSSWEGYPAWAPSTASIQ
jgi:TolB protein